MEYFISLCPVIETFLRKNNNKWGGWKKTSRGDVDVYAIGCGDGFKGIHISKFIKLSTLNM